MRTDDEPVSRKSGKKTKKWETKETKTRGGIYACYVRLGVIACN